MHCTFILTLFLGCAFTFNLTFDLASILTSFLAYILTFFQALILASVFTFSLTVYVASILTFFLAFCLMPDILSGVWLQSGSTH